MNKKTYLQESLRNGRIMRWTCKMPLKVYIAPMNFYSKQGQDSRYRAMVRKALDAWQSATRGKVSFTIVNTLLESQINVDWKRVERKALGHCYFDFDGANRLYSAEVSIGLTDGLIHRDYMDDAEVYHTILHEIGHAVGLGHSPFPRDIMYTPHQKGITSVSSCDVLTLNWLYTFPQGASVSEIASRYQVNGSDIDEIVARIMDKKSGKNDSHHKNIVRTQKRDLLKEQESIANLRRYHLAIQNVHISEDMRKFFQKPPENK
ncbi:matrixin family metalloprotease [bacterium]|nr:matrixin family metalloprotease [bacterium]